MFWKRKRSRLEMFTYETDSRRSAFRIAPSDSQPVVVKTEDREIPIRDISAGGLSFVSGDFKAGGSWPVTFSLPENDGNISVHIKIVSIDPRNVCHCAFKGIDDESAEAIHRYVLTRQKDILREKKEKEGR